MPTLSASWKASLPIRCVGTCPVKATIGIESIRASCSAVTRFVAGRPRGDEAHADPAGRARVALGRVAGGRLLADQDVAQPLEVVQRVVDRQDRAAGQAEDEIDAFPLQTLEQDPRPWQLHGFLRPDMPPNSHGGSDMAPKRSNARRTPRSWRASVPRERSS